MSTTDLTKASKSPGTETARAADDCLAKHFPGRALGPGDAAKV